MLIAGLTAGQFRQKLISLGWPLYVTVSQDLFWQLSDLLAPINRQRYLDLETGTLSMQFDLSRIVCAEKIEQPKEADLSNWDGSLL